MRSLIVALILIPLLELWLLIEVGSLIGGLTTVALVVLTAVVGLVLIRRQGLGALNRADLRMQQGEVPAVEMLEGLVLALAGIMLLVPGFATDIVGFACLVPPLRRALLTRWLRRVQVRASYYGQPPGGQRQPPGGNGQSPGGHDQGSGGGRTLEGDYRRED